MVPTRVRVARVLLLWIAAMYVTYRLGLGDPFGVSVLDNFLGPFAAR